MIRRPPRSTQSRSSAASDVYKRQVGTIAYSIAAFLPAATSLLSQLKTTAVSPDVRGLSVGNQWIGLANQSTWLVWAALIDERSVLLVGSSSVSYTHLTLPTIYSV